ESYEFAKAQTQILLDAGFDGALLENEYDKPYTVKAEAHAVSSVTYICMKLREDFPKFNLGLEFLINDPYASLSVAKVASFDFIRSDYYVDIMYREEYGRLEVNVDEFNQFREK